ncbi:MAG TPA: fluoride efflux transporter CrcB [Candidatus Didemnitutus sp.]|nr:fluoride efflux transporter CrcB [Candidatus Didemnitutus sp.]
MITYLLIAVGGAVGSVLRYCLASFIGDRIVSGFPWGTFVVNVTGSFIIGFFATFSGPEGRMAARPETRHFVMTGILGGYTTFSSFSLQTLNLAQDGDWVGAGAYAFGSLACCLVGVWLGHLLATQLDGRG